jgi:AbrB family looped-hinge helix DNA binding protein
MSTTVTVSPKYQIVIPQEVRERMNIQPGQKVTFVEWQGTIAIVPVLQNDEGFGFLKGKDVDSAREKDFGDKA